MSIGEFLASLFLRSPRGSLAGAPGRHDMESPMDTKTYPVTRTDAEWRKLLTPEQYMIMRQHGTERPGIMRAAPREACRNILLRRL